MKHLLIILLTAMISTSVNAQKMYTTSKDEETGSLIFKGPITFADLNEEPTFTWLKKGESAYKPDSNAIGFLRKELPEYILITLMGTWCDDSQYLIPRLSKVLQAAAFPMNHFLMYGVDRAKQTGGMESRIYEVSKVPTIIVFKGNKEVGRITESVKRSIEADLAQLIGLNAGH